MCDSESCLCNQSVSQLVSSLSAYEHLYFDSELFESDLPLQFLSYLLEHISAYDPNPMDDE